MAVPIFTVDAFTSEPFGGNPAAVCLLDALRWFTPTVEVDLCGHATLATAHMLWDAGRAGGGSIEFTTASGRLTAARAGDRLAALGRQGVIVTAAGGPGGHDFTSRYFAPAIGIPEDPVTGAAHCALAPLWADRLGRDALTGYQASARGGVVRVRLDGDRTILGGHAVTVVAGALTV